MTRTMLGSLTFQALGVSARRIHDFLLYEHLSHGGQENGNLAAPYKQLEAWGVTRADIRQGLAELEAAGFVRTTVQGMRVANGGEPSRYALTHLPTLGWGLTRHAPSRGGPPTHDWTTVIDQLHREGIGTIRTVRSWLKAETVARRRRKKPLK